MTVHDGYVFIVHWCSGDGTHVYDKLEDAIAALRWGHHRTAILHIVNWRTGKVEQIECPEGR